MRILKKVLGNRLILMFITFCSLIIGANNLEQSSFWFIPDTYTADDGRYALITTFAFITSFSITALGIKKLLQQNPRGIGIGFIVFSTAFLLSADIAYFVFNLIQSL